MANDMAGKWGYTRDGEMYSGCYDTAEEAAEEGALEEGQTVKVGQYRDPEVLAFVDADSVIERIICQDEYCGDWAEDALACTDEQMAELTEAFREAMRTWLDKHDLWPSFGIVDETREITVGEESK